MNVHVYQSPLTGHWIVDKTGTRDRPGRTQRQGWRRLPDALVCAWEWVAEQPNIFTGVAVQR